MSVKNTGQKVLKQLNEAGYEAYFVGGVVRDTKLGHHVYDIDITTNATPTEVVNLFDKTVETGLKHGTITVILDDEYVEVTTFRYDGKYLDNRHPDGVVFTKNLSDDLMRRDFTINAMAQGLDGIIIDPFNGQADLEAGIIRTVGNPKQRFEEDALRILRGIRFVSKLGFDIEKETQKAMKECRHLLANLSFERIRKEFEGILSHIGYQEKALELVVRNRIFEYIPFFSSLMKFENLNGIKHIATLFDVVAFELSNPKEFLSAFPLTRKERRMIQTLLAIRDDMLDERWILYRFGPGIQYRRHLLECFYYNKEFKCKLPTIIINSRFDLAMQPEEIIEISQKEAGSWVSMLFIEIEKAVVLEKIANTRESILEFIEKRGIFNVK